RRSKRQEAQQQAVQQAGERDQHDCSSRCWVERHAAHCHSLRITIPKRVAGRPNRQHENRSSDVSQAVATRLLRALFFHTSHVYTIRSSQNSREDKGIILYPRRVALPPSEEFKAMLTLHASFTFGCRLDEPSPRISRDQDSWECQTLPPAPQHVKHPVTPCDKNAVKAS
ncbi:hypothetical protein DAPPUDRAFT_126040, partial [Daphnia pulex]